MIGQSLFIELLRHVKRPLDSIRSLAELSKIKFSDKEFGDFFYRSVTKDIGKVDLLLEGFLKYLWVNAPLKKKNTVHRIIEEVLNRYQAQLEPKRIKLSKIFERDLPETIVPDEPLRYILNSILQYVVNLVTPNGEIGFLTKSFILQEKGMDQVMLSKNGQHIEIKVFFTGYKKPSKQFEKSTVLGEEEPLDLILRLVKEVVRRNRGVMKFEIDEKKEKTFISIRFPSERREIVYYQPING